MRLLFKVPSEVQKAFGLADNEKLEYCVPFDIDENNNLIKDGYVAVTKKRLIVVKGNEVLYNTALSELELIKCEPQVNSGLLVIRKKGGEDTVLVRFTKHHLTRMAFVARGADIFREGGSKILVCHEFERVCPKCGRGLPGTRECPKCDGKGTMFKKFMRLCSPYKFRLLFIAVLMVATAVLNIYGPDVQQQFIDNNLRTETGGLEDVFRFIGTMLAITLATITINVIRNWWCVSLGARISMDIRKLMYIKLQELTLSYIQDRKPGTLMNRVMRDTAQIRRFMEEAFGNMFSCIVTMVGTVGFMLTMNWKMTLLSVVFLPVALGISIGFRKNIHRRFRLQGSKRDKLNASLQDAISGMRVVKSFGKEKSEAEKFDARAEEFAVVQRRNEVFWASFFPVITFLMGVGVYFVTYLGGTNVLAGDMTAGTLLQFITYTSMLYGPLNWMTHLPRMITQMVTSLERIYDILDEEPQIVNSENAQKLEIKGEVEFKNVSFGYKSYEPVLKKINLKVKPGEMIGLVGASGAGKSTLINLIMRLYDVDDGEILIDGVNINDLNIDDYHSQLGVVLQETFLFSGTILQNLKFAKPDATLEEVIMAAKMANAHDFICKTPDGYNTYVGERGHNLSGGERQRIAIARAILNNPRLLILDEATSSLDTESEYLIQKALNRLTSGRTTFAIAHRLSTLREADRLVVIDNHGIAEVGTHNELLEKKGIYYNLVTAQLEMQSLDETAQAAEG